MSPTPMDLAIDAVTPLVGQPVQPGELERPGGRRLRWIETGTGPTIILVAGSGETCLDWTPVLPQLARRYRVIGYDRAGSGASDPMPRLSVAEEVADLAALLTAAGPAIVVGHSWGGLLSQLVTSAHPGGVRGLVLVDSAHEDVLDAVPLRLRLAERAMGWTVTWAFRLGRFERMAEQHGQAFAERCTDDPARREALVRAYLGAYSRYHQVAMIRDEANLSTKDVSRLRGRLPDIPLVALSATEKPEPVRRPALSAMETLCAAVPRGRHRVVDGCGHYIHHERPQEILDAVDAVASKPRDD